MNTKSVFLLLLLPAFAALTTAATDTVRQGGYTLSDLSFMEGRWQGDWGPGTAEEHWSAPRGNTIFGMFRQLRGDSAVFFEFFLVEQTPSGPVLFLRHFSPGLIAWEEEAQAYVLDSCRAGRAVFRNAGGTVRLVYERLDPSGLTAALEKLKNGAWTRKEFPYTRQQTGMPLRD